MPAATLRIRLVELPAFEHLTPKEMALLFGAGPQERVLPELEGLESRELMASSVFASLSGGSLYVEGTNNADNISVYYYNNQIRVTSNGTVIAKHAASSVKSVHVEGLGGSDTINLSELNGPTTIHASVWGGAGNDLIRGGAGNDRLDGGADNDTIYGGAGNDSIYGDTGNDLLFGEAGNDRVRGNDGNDTLSGGLHYDQIVGDAGTDRILETTTGSDAGNLTLRNDVLYGIGGDQLSGLEEAVLTGDARNNVLDASGFSGNVTLEGGAGDDTLKAGGGNNDVLYGQAGNDVLYGSAGVDHLNGGDDTDRYLNVDNKDTIVSAGNGIRVVEQIAVHWNALGGENSGLGQPTGNAYSYAGGTIQRFQHGAITVSDRGTFVISGAILNRYLRQSLGKVTGAEYAHAGGVIQRFEHGAIFSSDKGTYVVSGSFLTRYLNMPSLGKIIREEFRTVDGGYAQHFESGGMYQTPNGAQITIGDSRIWKQYLALGAEGGKLGIPVSNGIDFGGGWWGHRFQGGDIRVNNGVVRVVDFAETRSALAKLEAGLNRAPGALPAVPSTTVDFTNADAAKNVAGILKGLAQGNERSASVDRLEFDAATGVATGTFTVRHRQVAGEILGGKVVVYDSSMRGTFRYNVYTNDIDGTMDLGMGVKLDIGAIQAAIKGDFTQLILQAQGVVESSNYDQAFESLRNQHGAANVYTSSWNFTKWAGPETLARWTAEIIASGGTGTGKVAKEMALYLEAEATAIARWLSAKYGSTAESLVPRLIAALKTGKDFIDPAIEIRWQRVDYYYASVLAPDLKSPGVGHLGFAIVLKV